MNSGQDFSDRECPIFRGFALHVIHGEVDGRHDSFYPALSGIISGVNDGALALLAVLCIRLAGENIL